LRAIGHALEKEARSERKKPLLFRRALAARSLLSCTTGGGGRQPRPAIRPTLRRDLNNLFDRPRDLSPPSHGLLAETKAGLDQVVRERAYLLWEQAGRPDGRADDYWNQAQHQRFCERAYALWERENCPEGKSDQYWFRTRAFEES
jgi:Protein of unknown function (DUF2934)